MYKNENIYNKFEYIKQKLEIMVLGLIIAAIVGILVGQDASKRGMNAWGWGIGVFLLMIVFLPLYFILRKPKI